MYHAIGVIELKSIALGIDATDAVLKSANVKLVSAHPSCPGKYEILLTGAIADVTAAVDYIESKFQQNIIDCSVMGRIDPQVISALFGTQTTPREGSLGIIETYSAAGAVKAADLAVKCAKVELYDLRLARGIGGKGMVLLVGDVGDVTAAVEAGAAHAAEKGLLAHTAIIAAPHKELWEQL
ncbi:MAG: BMC domain-containing protein [Clostridia bacterium]|nr:BMC domain-containing protein [Clostridia bacterium]